MAKKPINPMDWISVNDALPETDLICYVFDCNWSLSCHVAIYHKKQDTFTLYDPKMYEQISLKVTHWIPLPVSF